jgi:O-methyltransferase involved in polyketide biosynthesis
VPNLGDVDLDAAQAKMRASTAKWREHGFDLDFAELGFEGERHDVGTYLDARGWTSVGTSMEDLLAQYGFPAIPDSGDEQPTMRDVTYYTSTLD